MKSPKRLYEASHIAAGVKAVAKLQQKVLEINPMAAGPMRALATQPGQEEPPEQLEGHCLGCQTKRVFNVEGESTMPNGAIRKHGKSDHPDCSHTVSTIVSKEKASGAA